MMNSEILFVKNKTMRIQLFEKKLRKKTIPLNISRVFFKNPK